MRIHITNPGPEINAEMRSFEDIGNDSKNNQKNEQIPQAAPRRID